MDTREAILLRLQDVLKTIVPGVVFSFPGGLTHAEITTDLGGPLHPRVYSMMRAQEKVDESECPSVEIVTSSSVADAVAVADDELYICDLNVQVWGYAKATDQGDGLDSTVRPLLNKLRADLIIAIEAFPYWTGVEPWQAEDARRAWGVMGPVLKGQWTEPSTENPSGYLVLEYVIRYPFNRRNP